MISAVVAAAALALGQQVDPHDFEVDVDIKPDVVVPATPSCVPAEGGGFLCTAQLTDTAAGKSVSGSARQVSTGKTGTFRMTIDWSLSLRAVVLVRNFAVESFRELSGGGQHTASWSIETADGTYVGDMRGTMRVSLAGPLTGRYEGQLTVKSSPAPAASSEAGPSATPRTSRSPRPPDFFRSSPQRLRPSTSRSVPASRGRASPRPARA